MGGGQLIVLDGSQGEGGGQILRSALSLSMATGKPFRIGRIRAGRAKPGLKRQHLTCVRAAARACSAVVEGAEPGSTALSFRPGPMAPGEYHFSVGGAGSSTLVFQTVFPALILAGKPFRLHLEGGTHNPLAPCLDFLAEAYLPCMRAMGVGYDLSIERVGFFPAGGGKWSIEARPPAALAPLRITERGAALSHGATVHWSRIPAGHAERQGARLAEALGWDPGSITLVEAPGSFGPGNVVTATLRFAGATEVITAFNIAGASPEAVADGLAADVRRFLSHAAPVGAHLADQLLLPMALGGGGTFRTVSPTSHTLTNIAIVGKFLPEPISVVARADALVDVVVPPFSS